MGTKSFAHKKRIIKADPETQPLMRMIGIAVRRLADRKDVVPVSVPEEFGAPARFIPSLGEIHVLWKWIARVAVGRVHNWDELVAKYPTIAGIILHEIAHARFTLGEAAMRRIMADYGLQHYGTFMDLSEGHAEAHLYPLVNKGEQIAMRSMVLEVVLAEIEPTPDDEDDKIAADIRMAFKLMALLAARVESKILDMGEPKTADVYASMVAAMGDYYEGLYDLAVEFSRLDQTGWDNQLDRANEVVQQWLVIENSAIEEAHEEERKRKEEEGGEGDGEGPAPQPDGEEEEEEEEESGSGPGPEPQPDGGEEPQEGVGGDSPDDEQGGEPGLGEYGGKTGIDMDAIREVVETMKEADQAQKEIASALMRDYSRQVVQATAASHAQRRDNNRKAMRRWQQ